MLISNPNKIERASQHTGLQMVDSRVLSALMEAVMNLCNKNAVKWRWVRCSVIPWAYRATKGSERAKSTMLLKIVYVMRYDMKWTAFVPSIRNNTRDRSLTRYDNPALFKSRSRLYLSFGVV